MSRLFLLLCVILFPKVAEAQSLTFNMHDDRNDKYVVMVDVSNQTLSVSKDGSSLFSKRYYNVKNNKGIIGFSFVQGKEPIMAFSENEQFFLITKETIIYNRMTSDQSLNYLELDNTSSFTSNYNKLACGLNNQSSLTQTPPSPTAQEVQTFSVKGVSFKMIKVEGDSFWMGKNESSNGHQVALTIDYWIGETEVTQALWQAVMGENPSKFTDNLQRPVEDVSWDDSQTFISKLNSLTGKNFRLPTEAEWEFAARGGKNSRGYKYAGSNIVDGVAWYTSNSGNSTHPVKQKQPNELGLYDMCGNVWEWCNDWYGMYSSESQTNPQGPSSGSDRVIRGGSWDNDDVYCLVSYRYRNYYPNLLHDFIGLRLAM